MLATSIITLEVGTEDRNDTMKKLANIKKQETNFKSMTCILTSVLQNLEFINNYIAAFDAHTVAEQMPHMKLLSFCTSGIE